MYAMDACYKKQRVLMVAKDFHYCPSCIKLIQKLVCAHMPLKDSQDEGWLNGIKKVLTNVPCPQHGWLPPSIPCQKDEEDPVFSEKAPKDE
jgi:hypothetical protein